MSWNLTYRVYHLMSVCSIIIFHQHRFIRSKRVHLLDDTFASIILTQYLRPLGRGVMGSGSLFSRPRARLDHRIKHSGVVFFGLATNTLNVRNNNNNVNLYAKMIFNLLGVQSFVFCRHEQYSSPASSGRPRLQSIPYPLSPIPYRLLPFAPLVIPYPLPPDTSKY